MSKRMQAGHRLITTMPYNGCSATSMPWCTAWSRTCSTSKSTLETSAALEISLPRRLAGPHGNQSPVHPGVQGPAARPSQAAGRRSPRNVGTSPGRHLLEPAPYLDPGNGLGAAALRVQLQRAKARGQAADAPPQGSVLTRPARLRAVVSPVRAASDAKRAHAQHVVGTSSLPALPVSVRAACNNQYANIVDPSGRVATGAELLRR